MKRFTGLALLSLVSFPVRAQNLQLQGSEIRLVDCRPALTTPGFRIKLSVTDEHGKIASVPLPNAEDLARSLNVSINDHASTPFYARAFGSGHQLSQGSRLIFVLIDVSGSMNVRASASGRETRFEAAQAALLQFVDTLDPDKDRIAIVPFESHHVRQRIESSPIVNAKAEARRMALQMPRPNAKNNTALYAAVDDTLDLLNDQRPHHPGETQALVVLTDGGDDVEAGDDAELFSRRVTLEQVTEKAHRFPGQVLAIGFGDPTEIDLTALRHLTPNVHETSEGATLAQILGHSPVLLPNQLEATVVSPLADLASLAGRTLSFDVAWNLPGGNAIRTIQPLTWTSGAMAAAYEGTCEAAELAAAPQAWSAVPIWRPALVFVGFGAVLLALWFGLPRRIWPKAVDIKPVRRSPGGPLGGDRPRAPERRADDRTIVQSRLTSYGRDDSPRGRSQT